MARIPQNLNSRRLDTGGVVRYSGDAPIAEAISGVGRDVSQIARTWQRQQEELDNFKTQIAVKNLDAQAGLALQQAELNMPVDGGTFHDDFVGQIGPNGETVKPGAFDQIAGSIAETVPESMRAMFMARAAVLRQTYSQKAAQAQLATRTAYYKTETGLALDNLKTGIANIAFSDKETFDTYVQQGEMFIDANGLPPVEKEAMRRKWRAEAEKVRFRTQLQVDPEAAQRALGVNPGSLVERIIRVESAGDPNAKNPRSSAMGLGQFTAGTWVQTVRKHAPEIAEGRSRAQILELRRDPAISRRMLGALIDDNKAALSAAGMTTGDAELYLAHFAGAQGAINLLQAVESGNGEAAVRDVLGDAAVEANPFLREMSAGELMAWATKKVGGPIDSREYPNLDFETRLKLSAEADRAMTIQYKAETEQEQEARRAITKDGYDLLLNERLTNDWLEANRDILNVSDYKAFSKALMPGVAPKRTPPAEYIRLLDLAENDPEEAISEVRELYANDIIAKDVFTQVLSKATAKQRQAGGRNFSTELRNYVSTALTPERDAPRSQQARKLDALFSFDDFVEANPGADREALRKQAQTIIDDFRKIRYASGVSSLPLPRYTKVTPDTLNETEIEAAKRRTVEAFQAGQINERETAEQAAILRRWLDIVRYRN